MTDPVAQIFADVFVRAARTARTDRVATCLADLAADCAAIEIIPSVDAAKPALLSPAAGRGPAAASTVPPGAAP